MLERLARMPLNNGCAAVYDAGFYNAGVRPSFNAGVRPSFEHIGVGR
jgi:hypothetical protein